MSSSCCPSQDHQSKKKFDFLLWGSASLVIFFYVCFLFGIDLGQLHSSLEHFTHSVHDLVNKMWIGVLIGLLFVGVLNKVPREFVISVLGRSSGPKSLLRAIGLGLLLDLCSHGILFVGMKLYERGASLGQTMAFLIASPWNSISLTIILIALIGLKWTLLFILLSAVMAFVSGVIFDLLVKKGVLPDNPNTTDLPENFAFLSEAKKQLKKKKWSFSDFTSVFVDGAKGSGMIIRWLLFGIILASALRSFLDVGDFQNYFGPSVMGLLITLAVTTILEVCSEGSSPIAADILTRANAPGNSFAFLMAGVSTDYTEIMALKETTRSWKIALFLPLVTLPQTVVLALILNM